MHTEATDSSRLLVGGTVPLKCLCWCCVNKAVVLPGLWKHSTCDYTQWPTLHNETTANPTQTTQGTQKYNQMLIDGCKLHLSLLARVYFSYFYTVHLTAVCFTTLSSTSCVSCLARHSSIRAMESCWPVTSRAVWMHSCMFAQRQNCQGAHFPECISNTKQSYLSIWPHV